MPKQTSSELVEERDLVKRAQAGDREALGVLCEKHRKRIFRTARAILHHREEAEDAVQEAFLKMGKEIKSFKGDSTFYTWLTRIVVNEAKMLKRLWWARNVDIEADLPETSEGASIYASFSERDPVLEATPDIVSLERNAESLNEAERALFQKFASEHGCSVEGTRKAALITRLIYAMRKLTEGRRSVIIMRYFEGKTIKTIARMEQCSAGRIKERLFRAHRALKQFTAAPAH